MGVRASYTAVPQSLIQTAQNDLKLWGNLSFDSPAGYLQCDIQKSWSTLWYLLDPEERKIENLLTPSNILGKAIMGAHVFCEHFCKQEGFEDELRTAYRHPRYCTIEEVNEASQALKNVSRNALFKAYDPEARRMKVYTTPPEDLAWMWFQKLTAFYQKASEKNQAVIVVIM